MARGGKAKPAAGDAPADKVEKIEKEIANVNVDQVSHANDAEKASKGKKNKKAKDEQATNEKEKGNKTEEGQNEGEQVKDENQLKEEKNKEGKGKKKKETRDTEVETDIHEEGKRKGFDKGKGDSKKEKGKGGAEKRGHSAKGKKKKDIEKKHGKEFEKYAELEGEEPEVDDVGVDVTPEKIAREYAYRRALECKKERQMQQQQDRWPPPVPKPPLKTKPWAPPGPPERPPKVIIELPKLKTQPWTPPCMMERQRRPKLPRVLFQDIQEPTPYEGSMLKKIWHGFSQVEPNKMILQGNLACNSKRYAPHLRGNQTGCIALVCRALLDEKTPAQMIRRDVDDVIEAADAYYKQCIKSMKCYKGKSCLELHQLLLAFFFRETKYLVELEEVDRGVLANTGEDTSKLKEDRPLDLLTMMEKQIGRDYMFVLTVDNCKHFLIWGHPPAPATDSHRQPVTDSHRQSATDSHRQPATDSQVKTVCYIFDPHMLDEFGNRSFVHGSGAFLRYPGVNSFVVDFLVNHSKLHKMAQAKAPVTLTTVEIIKKDRMWRHPGYDIDLKTVKPHCKSEWEAMNINAMIDEKLYKGKWPLVSMSAESIAASRRSSRKKVRNILGLTFQKPLTPEPLPVPPEKPPSPPPITTLDQFKAQENFFLHCPRLDNNLYGRDDRIPLADSEPMIYSQYTVAEETYPSQFSQLDEGKWILRATRHFASYRYQTFKSFTGVACCIAALAMLKKRRAKTWNEDSLDETYDVGYNLFRDSLGERHGPIRRLVLGELTHTFKMRNKQYKFKKRDIVVWGRLQSTNPKIFDLCRALESFFRESDSGILQIPGELETTIWYEDKKYYLYHPWPADENGTRVGLQGGGKGCLLSFSSIARLCEDFLENTKDLKRKPFCISDVTVWDLGERPEPVNSMKAVGPNRWMVRGTFNESDERFPAEHRSKQATPMCITAIAMTSLVDPDDWSQVEVDETLIRGDILYEKTMENLYKLGIFLEQPPMTSEKEDEEPEHEKEEEKKSETGVTGTLAAADVLPRFNLTTADCIEAEIQDSAFTGVLYPDPESGVMSLEESLTAMFKDNDAAVVTARDASMAVWKHNDHLYFFDPHGCDENGLPSNDIMATACLIRMTNDVKELADVIMGNLAPGIDDSFNISPVEIIATKIDPTIGAPEIKREGKAFEWLNRNTATILMGPRGENTAIGAAAKRCGVPQEDKAGRTIALPVVAAFCSATEAVPPPGMHQEHIFNFLQAGGEYYLSHVKMTGNKDITIEDLSERFEMGVNTFSIEVGEPITLPLRWPDPTIEEGGPGEGEEEPVVGATEGEEEEPREPEPIPMKEMKEQLFQMWYDTTKPQTVSILCGDYHQLGLWMTAGGKVVAFDPAPTLTKGLLTRHRILTGDELRARRLAEQKEGEEDVAGEAVDIEEPGAEGEAEPEAPPEPVPPESCPVLMVFASPGEFIDKLVLKGGLDPQQAVAPYSLYPVTVITELTSMVKPKKKPVPPPKEGDEEPEAPPPEAEVPLVEALADEALGKYFDRKTRTTASMRGRIAQDEAYFMDVPNRDNQDAAISIMGMIVHHIEPYQFWKPSLVDVILKYGDRLYTLSIPSARNPPRLAADEVIKEFHVTSFNVKTDVTPDVVTGDYKADEASELMSLRKGLKKFFTSETFGVICAKNYCAGVWQAVDGKAWVYWDPHPVGPTGKLSPASAAGVVLFSTLDELADTFKINLNNLERSGTNNYSISSVHVSWEFADVGVAAEPYTLHGSVPEAGYEWKVLTAYVEMARGRTILRGCKPHDILRFTRDSLLWSAPSAVVAVAMANIRQPQLWTGKTIEEIITNGCHLFTKSLLNLGYEFRPGEDVLHPLQVSKDFVLGSNYIRYDLQTIYSGRLEGRSHQVMTAELGLEKFFELFSYGILWSAPYAVAIWKLPDQPAYYMMEPHACGPTGLRTDAEDDAAACVMTFYSPKLMSYAYVKNLPRIERPKHYYTLFAVSVIATPIQPFKHDPPLVQPPAVPATSRLDVSGNRRDIIKRRSLMSIESTHSGGLNGQPLAFLYGGDDVQLKGTRNPNGWLVLKDKSQYISASHSMSCKRYPYASRGNQALAMCVMAVAESSVEEVCRWCNKTLDSVLDSGNMLYEDSFLHYKPTSTPILAIDQILRKFYTPGDCVVRLTVYKARQTGDVTDDYTDQLRQFFREEKKGVFVAHGGEFAVALFRTSRSYYMFDPSDCDRYGRAVPDFLRGRARACLSEYPNVQLLAEKLQNNVPFHSTKPRPKELVLGKSESTTAIGRKGKHEEDDKKDKKKQKNEDKNKDQIDKEKQGKDEEQKKRLSITEKVRTSVSEKMKASAEKIRQSVDKTKTTLEKKTSQVHFGSIDKLFKGASKPMATSEGRFAIYGMDVTALRKLAPNER